jgi:hypothetical protein
VRVLPLAILAALSLNAAAAELRVPASTAYLNPNPDGARVSNAGISYWRDPQLTVSWFGEVKTAGSLTAAVALKLPKDTHTTFKLTVGDQSHPVEVDGTGETATVKFGEFKVKKPGYVRFTLSSTQPAGEIEALILDGAAADKAHFNLDPRRNAASVHLAYSLPEGAKVTAFYNEITPVEDPLHTYYMACGFARGYFGMQVNSPTERRIIFSVWDSGSGESANNRSQVSEDNHVQLLAKGEGVDASVFGGEGTGGHSHLVYNWKAGEPQRFVVTAKAEGQHTDYSGYWFNPEKKQWVLLASFRAPKDGKLLRGLYSFSENFDGANGHLQRKALFGPQWIQAPDGKWTELTEASFSHDGTGEKNRLDRFMGVENGRFFLSQGGFVPGSTRFGEKFTRPASEKAPDFTPPSK